jgi:long-chain fatty acid transport protein
MTHRFSLIRGAVASLVFAAGAAQATNGYFTHGIGTHNKAMAGAGVAAPSQSIDAANNPAAGVLVGEKLDLGLAIFSPRRNYQTSESQLNGQFGSFTIGPNDIDSENEYFPIPYVAKNWKWQENQAITLVFYGRGGMNTEWKGGTATFDPDGPGPGGPMTFPGTYGAGDAGVDLSQAFLELAWSGQHGALSWGIAPIIAVQTFEATGVATFAPYTKTFAASGGTVMPENLTNNGHDWSWGYGLKGGLIWQASDVLSFGLVYQSRVVMEEFDKYSDLYARGGEFDIPASIRVGLSWKATDTLRLNFDIEHTQYGDIDAVGNSLAGLPNCPTAGFGGTDVESCFGGRNGAGFGWSDVTAYKLGGAWKPAGSQWTYRAGYSYAEQPIHSEDVAINIMAPGVIEQHITVGLSRERANGHEFSLSFMYAPSKTVSGTNFLDPTQRVELVMEQFELEFAYSF